ncbi:MAG: hypothetical protein WC683_07085 [bacterium]
MNRNYILFGSNTEVEEPMLEKAICPRVYDDVKTATACGLKVHGPWRAGFEYILAHPNEYFLLVCGICSTPAKRMAGIDKINANLAGASNVTWYTVKSSDAKISPFARIGVGALVLDRCYIAPDCEVGDFAAMLPGSALYHHSSIGEGTILVGGSVVLGRSRVGRECWVCSHATILPDGFIADGQVIGAAATVKQIGSRGAK